MENKVYPTIKNSILLCLLVFGIQIVAGILIGIFQLIFNISSVSLFLIILQGSISIISFAIVLLIGFKKTRRNFNEVFKFNNVSPLLWAAIVVFMTGFVFVVSELDNLLRFILPIPDMVHNYIETLSTEPPFILSIIIIGIIPTFTEELFFRGLILDGLKNNYSEKKAIIISSLLFGIIHFNPWQFLSAFIIGLFMAWICIKTNSILLCIYMHMFNNILSTTAEHFKNIIPIRGFNTNTDTLIEFQPLWLDLASLVLLILGIFLLKKGFEKTKMKTVEIE